MQLEVMHAQNCECMVELHRLAQAARDLNTDDARVGTQGLEANLHLQMGDYERALELLENIRPQFTTGTDLDRDISWRCDYAMAASAREGIREAQLVLKEGLKILEEEQKPPPTCVPSLSTIWESFSIFRANLKNHNGYGFESREHGTAGAITYGG